MRDGRAISRIGTSNKRQFFFNILFHFIPPPPPKKKKIKKKKKGGQIGENKGQVSFFLLVRILKNTYSFMVQDTFYSPFIIKYHKSKVLQKIYKYTLKINKVT